MLVLIYFLKEISLSFICYCLVKLDESQHNVMYSFLCSTEHKLHTNNSEVITTRHRKCFDLLLLNKRVK